MPTETSPTGAPPSTTGVRDLPRRARPSDLPTVASLAILAYAAASLLHEGLGHGGACLAAGGAPRMLTTVSFTCDTSGLDPAVTVAVAAGGTVVNLLAGVVAAWLYARRESSGSTGLRFFLWLFAAVNLMQAFGYLMVSGAAGVGDWAAVMSGVQPAWAWHIALVAGGGALYWVTTDRAFGTLSRFLGGEPAGRYAIGRRLALVSYGAGSALCLVAGALNPGGLVPLGVSAAAASLGGTCGLVWGPMWLRGARDGQEGTGPPARIPRDLPVIAAAGVVALLFVFGLGPGVPLG
jgi:hypothetical protein